MRIGYYGISSSNFIVIEFAQVTNCIFNYNVTCKLDTYNDLDGDINLYVKVMKKVFYWEY